MDLAQFEKRKLEHITLALSDEVQSPHRLGWDLVSLPHEAFPEINFEEVDTSTSFFSYQLSSPFFISSMTAGHQQGEMINSRLAEISHRHQILMGVGSQRKELSDSSAAQEWKNIRKKFPRCRFMSNIGLTQLITHRPEEILHVIDSLEAVALIVHTNPLQEALQVEGTPQFRGGLKALTALVESSPVPIIVKEVGFGFSQETLKKLNETGIAAVDVSGRGGTHWGRIEGLRSQSPVFEKASQSFQDWGYSTFDVLKTLQNLKVNFQVWASGGVRNGLEAAKAMALGAQFVGMAQPWLRAALESEEKCEQLYQTLQLELKTSLFCTGSKTPKELYEKLK